MNDRYLYKAKRIDTGEWVEGYLSYPHCTDSEKGVESYYFQERDENGWYSQRIVEASTICQCTGLKDKNGKLICENDIVRYNDMITGVEKIDRIEWNETYASFVRLHRSKMGLQYLNIDEFIANGCEVIGSAIDNTELLEVGT